MFFIHQYLLVGVKLCIKQIVDLDTCIAHVLRIQLSLVCSNYLLTLKIAK